MAGKSEEIARIQQELRPDVYLVRAYGEGHPESWSSIRFENTPKVRIVAGFTDDVPTHEAALQAQVAHPDRLVIERHRFTNAQRMGIMEELRQRFKEHRVFHLYGPGTDVVSVTLHADQEPLAAELTERYGDAVAIRLGFLSYPDRKREQGPSVAALSEITVDDLDLDLEPDRRIIEAGYHRGTGVVTARNVGNDALGPLDTGSPLTAHLLDHNGRVLGGSLGLLTGVGRTLVLGPGAEETFPVVWGTASLDPDLGYVLPPGTYFLRASMRFSQPDLEPVLQRSSLAEITITA